MQRLNSPETGNLFVDGNPPLEISPTILYAYWLNTIQEECCNVVELSGLTLDPGDNTQLWTALTQKITIPLIALDKPVIDTADNTIGATGAIATAGGTVSVPVGKKLSITREVIIGQTGWIYIFTTTAYTSADLDVSSTCYLRSQVDGDGALEIYVQKGTDSDPIPASLKGTPGGLTGGGFPSTVLDILLAKIVTGAAGTTPTVTNIPNARMISEYSCTMEE